MRCFDYPFDPAFILQKKRALRRELLASEGLVPKKVAILSGSTVGEIKNILELFLLNAGIRPEFYVGGYALFYEELTFDPDGALAAFGRVDVLVNNAGVAPRVRADLLDMSEESFDYVVGINTKGNMFLTQLVAKQMISQEPVDGRKASSSMCRAAARWCPPPTAANTACPRRVSRC